ncbi:MAG: polysaccharide ABC transporter ATP-binding protein [Longimicrobiales bacterium]
MTFDRVSKQFRLGRRVRSVRDAADHVLDRLRGRRRERQQIWALRDISFEVGAGEALGIIGPNGAGKSTLLRLLAGILRPDAGRIAVHGTRRGRARVGALIELAAGFHYDLTGRENIYLQGAVLGMPRVEITRKFDAIVEFAELERFVDTPVKHYSSGMSARLGFSIAAHLDPEILIVDEVLAVGDWAFQQRAFERIREATRRDVVALVVSHQLNLITELCSRAILLTRGRISHAGPAAECVAAYVENGAAHTDAEADTGVRVCGIRTEGPDHVGPGERVRLHVRGSVTGARPPGETTVGIRVRALPREDLVFVAHTDACGVRLPERGAFEIELDVRMNVAPGTYRAQAAAWDARSLRELSRGPTTLITVGQQDYGIGPVFCEPRARLLEP